MQVKLSFPQFLKCVFVKEFIYKVKKTRARYGFKNRLESLASIGFEELSGG